MGIFIVLFLEVVGFATAVQVDDSCLDALHALRTEHRLAVLKSEDIREIGVVYILGDGPFRPERTAILFCGRELQPEL
jgi:hypothetical protein